MTININTFGQQFIKEYEFLYENYDRVAGYSEAVAAFDDACNESEAFCRFVAEFAQYRGDYISSDREAAAFMFALDTLS